MHHSDARVIALWIRTRRKTGRSDGPTGVTTGRFLYTNHGEVRHPSHGFIAEFTRPHYDIGGHTTQTPPVVMFSLPNILTWHTQRDIRAMLTREGIRSVVLPFGVMDQAGISILDLEVLDEQPSTRFPRPHHALVRSRGRYYLSGYDIQERNSYFFCEVSGEPGTIEQAYQNLKPESVKIAEAQGRKIKRQGDMFFIRATKDEAKLARSKEDHGSFRGRYGLRYWRLFDSNHYVRHHRFIDGVHYVQGDVRHMPTGRRADHRALSLGRGWWLCVQNAVPVVQGSPPRSARSEGRWRPSPWIS